MNKTQIQSTIRKRHRSGPDQREHAPVQANRLRVNAPTGNEKVDLRVIERVIIGHREVEHVENRQHDRETVDVGLVDLHSTAAPCGGGTSRNSGQA